MIEGNSSLSRGKRGGKKPTSSSSRIMQRSDIMQNGNYVRAKAGLRFSRRGLNLFYDTSNFFLRYFLFACFPLFKTYKFKTN